MSVGNITPRTATQTLAGMLLGAETYPSALQQALCNNTGWLMYRPLRMWQSDYGGTLTTITASGTVGVSLGYCYLTSGNFDISSRIYCSSHTGAGGTAWLNLNGTRVTDDLGISINTYQTFEESFTGFTATEGWYLVSAYVTSNASASSAVYTVDMYSRQYS